MFLQNRIFYADSGIRLELYREMQAIWISSTSGRTATVHGNIKLNNTQNFDELLLSNFLIMILLQKAMHCKLSPTAEVELVDLRKK